MTSQRAFPEALQNVCDKVVAAALNGSPAPSGIEVLQDWLSADGWDLITDAPGEIFLTDIGEVSRYFDDDFLLSDLLGWNPGDDIDFENLTDSDRLKWAR